MSAPEQQERRGLHVPPVLAEEREQRRLRSDQGSVMMSIAFGIWLGASFLPLSIAMLGIGFLCGAFPLAWGAWIWFVPESHFPGEARVWQFAKIIGDFAVASLFVLRLYIGFS